MTLPSSHVTAHAEHAVARDDCSGRTASAADPRNVEEAAARVARLHPPPFVVYSVGAHREGLRVEVAVEELATAEAYFNARPVKLADGTSVTVRVDGVRAGGWVTCPLTGPVDDPGPLESVGVKIGLSVERRLDARTPPGGSSGLMNPRRSWRETCGRAA